MRTMRTMPVWRSAVHDLMVAGSAAPRDASAERSPPTLNNLPRADMSTDRTSSRSLNSAMQRLNSRQKVAVDRIAAVGLIENDVRQPAIDRAVEARCGDCQTHRVSTRLFGLVGNAQADRPSFSLRVEA